LRVERLRCSPQFGQDPVDVEQAGRLYDPCDDEIAEALVGHDVEPEAGVDPGKSLIHNPRGCLEDLRARHHRSCRRRGERAREQPLRLGRDRHHDLRRYRRDPEIEDPLPIIGEQTLGLFQQQPQIGLVTC